MNTYDIVKKCIDEYDFDDLLAIGAPNDEYDTESEGIAQRINAESSVEEIADVIADVFHQSMGELLKADVDNPDSFTEIATKIKHELKEKSDG